MIYHETEHGTIYCGDSLEVLKGMADESVDCIVTDPPYGLSFMGKKWDYDVPSTELWTECLRVLRPGGHLLAFAGTRTQHRMAVRIEDAGFEIRDMIAWIYGSGFPKSRDIGKDIEKINVGGIKNLKKIGSKKGIKGESGTQGFSYSKEYVPGVSIGGKQIQGEIPIYEINNEWQGWGTALKPSQETICLAQKPIENSSVIVYNDIKEVFICLLKLYVKTVEKSFTLNHQEQSVVSNIAQWIVESNINIQADLQEAMDMLQFLSKENMNLNIVISWLNILVDLYKLRNTSTIEMVLSMTIELKILKSLEWENILQNITQVKNNKISGTQQNVLLAEKTFSDLKMKLDYIQTHFVQENATSLGRSKNLSPDLEQIVMARKPVEGTIAQNVLKHGVGGINIDGCRVSNETITYKNGPGGGKNEINRMMGGNEENDIKFRAEKWEQTGRFPANLIHDGSDEVLELFPLSSSSSSYRPADKGGTGNSLVFKHKHGEHRGYNEPKSSAARFFYCAKASRSERGEGNVHPTVKPIALMQYLCRLVTPPNGIVLDPFFGSGSTGCAAIREGFRYIGIDISEDYCAIAAKRIDSELQQTNIFREITYR